ncbi:MAG TPA: hypothetical protein VII44_03775 [Puia sp.]
MQSGDLQTKTTSLQLQLLHQEKLFDEAMKHDEELGEARKIYLEIKKLRERLKEIRQLRVKTQTPNCHSYKVITRQ